MSKNLISQLQAAAPAARTLAMAELKLSEAARQASDFARAMVPNGYLSHPEPGTLVRDALQLVDHARQVLAAACCHERAHGTADAAIAGLVSHASLGLATDLMGAVGPDSAVRSDNITERLFELDAWLCRHTEPDDPIASRQPVTDAMTRRVSSPG